MRLFIAIQFEDKILDALSDFQDVGLVWLNCALKEFSS